MEPVYTPDSVSPIGPYSQAIRANGFIFLSGQIPATPEGQLVQGTVAEKTHRMCQNAKAVLGAAGSGLEKVVKVHVYFQNIDDFKELNEVYAEYFPHKPARSASEASKLPAGILNAAARFKKKKLPISSFAVYFALMTSIA